MSDAKPLSREAGFELDRWARIAAGMVAPFTDEQRATLADFIPMDGDFRGVMDRYEATVRDAEARADALASEGDELARLLDESLEREKALEERADALRGALEEISVPPDARSSKGEDYGCLDLHEARVIAFDALDSDDRRRAGQGEPADDFDWTAWAHGHIALVERENLRLAARVRELEEAQGELLDLIPKWPGLGGHPLIPPDDPRDHEKKRSVFG